MNLKRTSPAIAATLLLLSPLVFYGIYRAANRLFYEFKEWWIDRRDSK